MGLTRLAARRFTSDRDPRSLSMRLRSRRIQPLLAMIEEVHGRYGHVTIIDVGGNRQYWSLLPTEMFEQKRISVTVVNPDKSQLGEEEPHFSFIQGDGCDLSMFNASAFHIANSNSVLEHVGGWNRMRRFFRRDFPGGRAIYGPDSSLLVSFGASLFFPILSLAAPVLACGLGHEISAGPLAKTKNEGGGDVPCGKRPLAR